MVNAKAAGMQVLRELSKSGIVTLVLISVLGGYFIGVPAGNPLDLARLLLTLLGILLLSSGSSALNQLQEIEPDRKMARTAKRPLPSGRVSPRQAGAFVAFCLVSGLALLAVLDLRLLAMGAAATFSYNVLYTLWWKPRWAFAAIPGAIPGALPIWMGHVASAQRLWEPAGLYLFGLLFFWQMPHFWVLALRYSGDYASGGFPTLPVKKGRPLTVAHIAIWAVCYVAMAWLAPLFMPLGGLYFATAAVFSIAVLVELVRFARSPGHTRWLQFFLWVNLSLVGLLAGMALDRWKWTFLTPWLTR